MSLKNVCFENIKDEFYYGKFGEFTLVIDKNTGFFNATKLCKQSNKKYSNWFSNKRTISLIFEINILRPRNSEGGECLFQISN